MKTINICEFTNLFAAWLTCTNEWKEKHEERLIELLDILPSGSGIDSGIKFDWEKSNRQKLVFTFGFHHMNEVGYYDGWTYHVLTIAPSFPFGYSLKISGSNRNQIKDYLYDLLSDCFSFDPMYLNSKNSLV